MTQEEIENAGRIEREKIINELQDGYNNHHHDINLYTVASATIGQYALPLFVSGANWRINSVWHDISESPKPDKLIYILRKDGIIKHIYTYDGVDKLFNTLMVYKWAYSEDLIPNKED